MKSHVRVIEDFKDGKYSRGCHVFADGYGIPTLYSYGNHFKLAVRREPESNIKNGNEWFLLNGDKYSVSTSKHQSITFSVFHDYPRVSFTAIHAAGINENTVELVDFTRDEYKSATKGKDNSNDFDFNNPPKVPGATWGMCKDKVTGEIYYKYYHRVGGVLLKYNDKYYLCAMDERQYFVCKLPGPCQTVQNAFDMLKPEYVVKSEKEGIEVLRQGEWFFITADIKIKEKDFSRSTALPYHDENSNRHVCTRLIEIDGNYYVKGTVNHKNSRGRRGTHKRLKLGNGKTIYSAHENTAVNSWSYMGNVD